MKQKRIFVGAAVLMGIVALFGFAGYDGDDIIKKIAGQLGKWSAANPQEKVYLHLDKPYYAIGDDIWFKAYVTIGADHRLSATSGILNVELISDKDSIKKAIKVPLSVGMGAGSFKLADSLSEGNYRIRAYTNLMRNAGDEYFFDRMIQVGNSISNNVFTKVNYTYTTQQNNQQKVDAVVTYTNIDGRPYDGREVTYEVQLDNRRVARGKGMTKADGSLSLSFVNNMPTLLKSGTIITNIRLDAKLLPVTKILPVKSTSLKVDMQFFPESGYLVNGVHSKVAFKAVGADGLGVDVKGIIVDDKNNEVAQLATQHLGMGIFYLSPEKGKTYTAKVTYADGSTAAVALPAATDRGYVLSVNNSDPDNVILRVALSPVTFQEQQGDEISLIAQSGGVVVYAAKSKLESAMFTSRVARSRFPAGIVQFTLFNSKGEPLNERIAFMQNTNTLNVKLGTPKGTYTPREKVKLNITSANKDGQPVTGAFSLSVIDETKVPVDESSESTILSNILLSSDIKGYIEKPNYYFTNISDKTRADLDILMLTQGYRRFTWKQVMADNFPPLAFQPEKSLNITGHIKTLGGKPIPHGKVTLLSTSGGMFIIDTVADEQGRFAFNNLIFTDSVKFAIQARTAKDKKNVQIDLDNIDPQLITRSKNRPDVEVNISSSMATYLQNSKRQFDDLLKYGLVTRSTFLKEVSITEKKAPILKYSDNLNGPGNADQVIKSDDLELCATLSQCLVGKVSFVMFRNGMAYSTRGLSGPMAIVVDGIQMDSDFLDQLNAADVESVEVLRTTANTAIYGMRGSNGVLVITTKRGDSGSSYQRYAPGIITYTPVGYQRVKQFYSPKYDDPKTNAKVADLRTTIYWTPNIITDKNGNASVEYFNADNPGTYRAVIEGIDSDGNLARQVYRYKVQ